MENLKCTVERVEKPGFAELAKSYSNDEIVKPGDFTLYYDGNDSHLNYFVLKEKSKYGAIIIGISLNYNASDIIVNAYKVTKDYLMKVDDSFVNIGSPLWKLSELIRSNRGNEIIINGDQANSLTDDDINGFISQSPYKLL